MDGSDISPDYELNVRHHLRQTFLPYVRKHIIKDTVAYTEARLEQIFTDSLDFIPLTDPHTLVLPADPLDILLKSIDSLDLSLDERWATDVDTIRRIKTILQSNVGKGREPCSEIYWQEEDHLYTRLAELYRPMTRILTNRARTQTPIAGSNKFRASLPCTQPALFEQIGVKPVAVEQIQDMDPLKLEEVLKFRPTIDSTTRDYILSQVKFANSPIQSIETNPHVTSFLRVDSPPLRISRPLSPPIFLKSRTYSSSCRTRFWDVSDRINSVPVSVTEDPEDDTDYVDMMIVDGWAVPYISSPPCALPTSSEDEQIDELWEASPSPPGTPATSLLNARMDDVEIPRIHRPGHTFPSASGPITAKTMKSFVDHLGLAAPMKSKKANFATRTKLSSTNTRDNASLSDGSMFGQPPSFCASSPLTTRVQSDTRKKSNLDRGLDSDDVEIDVGKGLDMALRYLYREAQDDNIEGCVLEERLNEKEVGLMNVPHLPPPTVHRATSLQPTTMRALTGGGKGITTSTNVSRHTILECVKGIKPLNLELSWRPFKFTHPIPTDESVSLIEGPAMDELEKHGYIDKASEAKMRGLLENLETEHCRPSSKPVEHKYLEAMCDLGDIGLSPPPLSKCFENDGFELVLTRRERRLLAGLPEFGDPQEIYRQERQQASLVMDEGDQHAAHLTLCPYDPCLETSSVSLIVDQDFHDDQDLRFGFGDSNPAPSILSTRRQIFDDAPHDLVLRDCGVGFHSDIMDDVFSAATFDDDSGVVFPVHEDQDGCHRVLDVASDPRYLDTVYPPDDIDDLDPTGFYSQNNATESGFFPLSFGSQIDRIPGDSIKPVMFLLDGDVERSRGTTPDDGVQNREIPIKAPLLTDIGDAENVLSFLRYFQEVDATNTAAPAFKRRRLDDLDTTTLAPRASLDDHLALRSKLVTSDPPPPTTPKTNCPQPQAPQTNGVTPPRVAPPEILDNHTLRLPDIWNSPATSHHYLASIDVIQKRALIQALAAPQCAVHLVERYVLGGVDVVMDQDTAVLLVPLLALPFHVEVLTDLISRASWRYSHILIIFEAFPSGNALTANTTNTNNANKLTPYAFSPPMLKAVKKFRRLVSIAESFGTKNAGCEIQWAFANDVEEAALFIRIWGNLAEERACNGGGNVLWGDREWLQIDEHEEEAELATVDGMNAFAAFVMLCQGSLQELLDMSPDQRVAAYSHLVGRQRIVTLNAIIEQRSREMEVDLATECGIDNGIMDVGTNDFTRY